MKRAKTLSQLKRERGITQDRRPSAAKRGYGRRWQKESKRFLNEYPLCVECLKDGTTRVATVVDHIKPHNGDMKLFWDKKNWQRLCAFHHNRKTAKQDGGFGNG